jgi:glycosyltransferase involved in cell wall biosynthesis
MTGKRGMRNKANRLRVLHVIPSVAACRGGPSKAVIEMVAHLRNIDVDAEIATTNDDGNNELVVDLNKIIEYKGAPTRFFKRFSPPLSAIREFAYSGSFRRWLRRHIGDYDVIHVHAIFSFCSSFAMYLAKKRGIPYVVRPLGLLQHWSLQQSQAKKQLYLRLLEQASIESASAIHFTAESEMREATQQFHVHGHVIPLGIEKPAAAKIEREGLEGLLSIEKPGFTILYLSRIHKKKGLELLMRAIAKIETEDVNLLIAGEGNHAYKTSLRALSKDLKLDDRCFFLGQVEGGIKAALLAHSDLFALTSHSENFGISVLEAMAYGLAPLVSNQVALSTVISEQSLGLTCTLEINDIEQQLRYALTNRDVIASMGQKAKQHAANHYSWPSVANQLKSLYSSIT